MTPGTLSEKLCQALGILAVGPVSTIKAFSGRATSTVKQTCFGNVLSPRSQVLVSFHAKTEAPSNDGDYQIAIQRVVETDVRPAALEFKNKLESIHETLFGKFKGSAIKWVRGSGLTHLLAGMSWSQVLMLAGGAVAAEAVAHVSEARQA
jgi:hypothetical protein